MPDPNAHADDMKSPAQPNTLPSFWWLNPWREAIAWHRRAENAYLSGVEAAKKYVKLANEKLASDQEVYEQANRIIALNYEIQAEQKKAKDFEQRWLEANEALTKEQGEHEETQEKLRAAKASAEGHSKLVELALADKDEAEKGHAEEHKANILLNDQVLLLKDEIFWIKHEAKAKAKRKRKAKKKAVRRG